MAESHIFLPVQEQGYYLFSEVVPVTTEEIITTPAGQLAEQADRLALGAIAVVVEVAGRVATAFLGQVEPPFIATLQLHAGIMGAGMVPAVAEHQADVVFSLTLKAVQME